jgi:hypothetical protein
VTETRDRRNVRAASNTFTADEIVAFNELLRTVRRGGDPRVIMRADGILRLERKFAGMLAKIQAHREAAR